MRGKGSRARTPEVRVNSRVKAREVRLIDPEGQQLGVVNTGEALRKAEDLGVDLVEIAPNADPPVCRLMDYGKYKYELKKQQVAKKQKTLTVKEIKLRPNIGDHDLNVKVNRIKEFLQHGHKTKVRIYFRGREIVHPEIGNMLAKRICEQVDDYGTVDTLPKMEGRNLMMVLSPKKKE